MLYGSLFILHTFTDETSDNPFPFAGRENDGTGLQLDRNRYYSYELLRYISEDPIRLAGGDLNYYVRVGGNPINFVDPVGLLRFKVFNNIVDLQLSGTFLPITIGWDLKGLRKSNFSYNGIFPPLSAGFGLDISINPPSPCEKYVSPYIGLGKNLSIGTNVILVSDEPLKLKRQGINISLGLSLGIPIGVVIPDAFSN